MSGKLPDSRTDGGARGTRARNPALLWGIGIAIGLAGTIATVAHEDIAAVTGAGDQRTYDVAGFEKVSAIGPQQVVVSVGPAFSVRGTGGADALDRFDVALDNGALIIRPKNDGWWGFPWSGAKRATFYVTLPQLSAASLVGSGEMKIDRVGGPKFAADIAGSGQMEIAALTVDDADFSLSGSGDLLASGKVRTAHLSIAGSGDIRTSGLTSDTADVSMVGSGDAALTVNSQADVSIMGSGDVTIGGAAHCKVSRVGSGDVKCPV